VGHRARIDWREARLKALGYKHPELWQADPFVRKTGALDD
jgi:hypothetical protein